MKVVQLATKLLHLKKNIKNCNFQECLDKALNILGIILLIILYYTETSGLT